MTIPEDSQMKQSEFEHEEMGYHTGDVGSLVVNISKCKGSQDGCTTQKAEYGICTVSGIMFVQRPWDDPIPENFNMVYRFSVDTCEDSVVELELPEKGNELTADLDKWEYSDRKSSEDSMGGCDLPENKNELTVNMDGHEDSDANSTVSASKQPEESCLEEIKDKTSDQKPERFIQSEQDTGRHEEICSPVTASSKEFKCPPCLRELFTFVPTPTNNTCGENTHSSAKSTSTKNSRQVNSETIQVSLTKDKASGRNVVGGNDSTQNTKGQSTQQQKQQQKQQQQSASGGDSSNVSGSGSGDHGNGRDDGDKKKDKSAANGEQKNEEQEEAEEEEDEDKDEEKQDEENKKQEIDVLEQDYISRCLMVYIEYIRDQNCGRQVQQTDFTRSGERYLGHLQQCGWGHIACKDCHHYLCTIEDLVSSRPVDAASLFPFYEEYSHSKTQKERHLVILEWLYWRLPEKYVEAEICREKLKRIRSSSGQGARPKKRVRQTTSSNSSEPMEITPSPEEGPPCTSRFCGASRGHVLRHQDERPSVIHGSRAELHRKIKNWMRNPDATDGEFNDGVIFDPHKELIPNGGYYRPNREIRCLLHLGSGSYGQVFLGADCITDKLFVYKIVDLENFEENEVLIWMRLQHKHIVPLWAVVRHGNDIIMISAYISSRPLPIRLDDNLPRSDRQVVKWIKQLLGILEYIHSMNIVHMDIKPENILLYEDDIFLIDWGLSMELNEHGMQQVPQPRGTELYMAREVVRCETFNATVDIWSTICAAIYLFSGRAPWLNRFPSLPSYQYIIGTRGPPVEDIPASLDPVIRDFLTRGLGNDQGRPTASELMEDRMFCMDNFTRQPPFPHDLNIESEEEKEMKMERPIPPPDGILDFDISSFFKTLGDHHSGGSGGCDMGQNLPTVHPPAQQQGLALSPECLLRDGPQGLDRLTILQPLGQASPPGAQATVASYKGLPRPQVLVPRMSRYPGDSPVLDDLTCQRLGQLNISEDEEDLYGPGPCEIPGSCGGPVLPLTTRPPDRSESCERPEQTDILVTPDRRSSSQSSVFGDFFPCLSSTPETDVSIDISLGMSASDREGGKKKKRESFPSSTDQLRLLERLHSEYLPCVIDFDHQPTTMHMAENATSGFGTASVDLLGNLNQDVIKPVQRRRTESQNSRNLSGQSNYPTFNIQLFSEEIPVRCGTSTYGELAEGISSKVLGKFRENGISNARFTLTDQCGNSFDENAEVDCTCEIVIAEADPDGDWDWCITPDNGLERK